VNALSALPSAAVAFAITVALTPVVRWGARRLGYVAAPRSDRWHQSPTALLGGVAVFAGTAAGVAFAPAWSPHLTVIAAGSAAAFAIGLFDDLLTFRPVTKLTLQVVLASAALAAGVRLAWTPWETVDSVLTVLWLIGLTNAFNLIDNMDGACAGVGAIAAGTLTVIALLVPGGTAASGLAAALCGALLGFLIYNHHPASVFLGDSGSLFVGFMLAGLSAVAKESEGTLPAAAAAVPVLVLLVPIFDTALVTISRKLSGRPASRGGTDHTAHRLVALGFSETKAVWFLYSMALASGTGAILLLRVATSRELVLGALTIALLLLGLALLRVRVYGGEDFSLLLGGRWRSALAALLLRHHVFEVTLDVVLVTAAYFGAYRFRFEGEEFNYFFPFFASSLPIVIACKVVSLRLAGAYGVIWRYFGTSEVVPLLRGVGLGSAMAVLSLAYLYRFERVSRSVLILDGLLFAALVVGSRLAFRLLPASNGHAHRETRRAVAYGAGDAGEMLVRELANNPRYTYHLTAFLDDDPYKRGRRIRGVPVVGGIGELGALLENGAEAVILTTDKLPAAVVQAARAGCEAADVPLLRFSSVLEEVKGSPRRQRPSPAQRPAGLSDDGRPAIAG
jgi:UDP-GlcNAc:undecaprenyl-phosphate/decaprenyl-phosphate GlcNAc-1-phosphate transferase